MNGAATICRRRLLAAATAVGAAAVIPAVGGCTPDRPDAPTITKQQVQRLQDDYAHNLFEAMRTRNRKLLRSIETDPLLTRDLATIDLGDRLKVPKSAAEYTLPNATGYPVEPPTDADHPDRQQLIIVSDYSNTKPSWRDLALYVRDTPSAGWRRAYGAGLYASDVPAFDHDHPLAAIAADADGYQTSPNTIPGIVAAALADPDSQQGQMFGASDVRNRYATALATRKQQAAKIGTVTRSYRPGVLAAAIKVGDGYLALGTFGYDETLTARAGQHVTFAEKSAEHRGYPGRYRTTTAGYGAMFATLVPKQGKIMLISGEERQTGLAAE